MDMFVTERQTLATLKDYSVKETPIKEMSDALDPSKTIIEQTGQFAEPDGLFIRLCNEQDEAIAAVVLAPAETSQFQRLAKLPIMKLDKSILLSSVWVAPQAQTNSSLAGILYFALRRSRIWGRQNVCAMIPVPNTGMPLASLLHLDPLENLAPIGAGSSKFIAVAGRVEYSILKAYDQCADEILRLINNHFIDEILETHRNWLECFYRGSWSRAVLEGTLSKEQYISSLYNLHQYVRQTTRLAARSVAHSDEINLRNHYINHLRGEINHELLIERDLAHLGADVDYVRKAHVPHPATKQFMVVQESTIGFYQDPIMMLACPMAAEGVAANMTPDFLEALYKNIASWGIEKPQEAARFLSSHVNTDGGDDGHWQQVIDAIKNNIHSELELQRFLSVMVAAMQGFESGFNANVDDLKLWEK